MRIAVEATLHRTMVEGGRVVASLVRNSPHGFLPREPQLWIGRPHARFRQAEFPADDIGALDKCHTLVKRNPPRQALAAG